MNLNENIQRIHQIMGVRVNSINEGVSCSEEGITNDKNRINHMATNILPKSVDWWNKWLSAPVTKQKFMSNNKGFDAKKTDEVFKKYFSALQQIKLSPYGGCTNVPTPKGGEYAYMYAPPTPNNYNVYVNFKYNLDDDTLLETFTHEIQHILFFIQPLNPQVKIEAIVTPQNYKKGGMYQNISNLMNTPQQTNSEINSISKSFSIPTESATNVWDNITKMINLETEKNGDDYLKNYNEFLSRLSAIRQKLNLTPTTNFTKELFIPYINKITTKNSNELKNLLMTFPDMVWVLLYWGQMGFKDFGTMMDGFNSLAYQNKNKPKDNTRVS